MYAKLNSQNSMFKLETKNFCSFSLPLSSCHLQITTDQSVLNPLKFNSSDVSTALYTLVYVLLQVEAKISYFGSNELCLISRARFFWALYVISFKVSSSNSHLLTVFLYSWHKTCGSNTSRQIAEVLQLHAWFQHSDKLLWGEGLLCISEVRTCLL